MAIQHLRLAICTIFATGVLGGARAQADDAPAGVLLRSFSHAGTGCPAGTVTGNFPVDGNEFDITYGGFAAEIGGGAPIRDKRKNCSILLDLDVPAGWQFTVESIEYFGAVDLEQDVQGLAGSSHYFQGEAETVRFTSLFDGPVRRRFTIRDTIDPAEQVWSPCGGGRALNLNMQVRLEATTDAGGAGTVAFGRPNGLAGTQVALEWRPCS